MIRWLLERYVAQPWLDQVDLDTLEPVKARFVGDEHQQRESDLIWRAKLLHVNEWFYVFILLEFQSVPERFMPFRVLEYMILLWKDLIRQKVFAAGGQLPPILPVVLYNGSLPWNHPIQVSRLIAPIGGGIDKYCPHFEFLLIDEGHIPKEKLGPLDNPVTAIFYLEQAQSDIEIRELIGELGQLLKGQEMNGPRRAMLTWLRRVLLPISFPGEEFPELPQLEETDPMLAERVKQWPKQWMAEGRAKGLEEGLQMGRLEGRQEGRLEGRQEGLQRGLGRALEMQLEIKFGPLDEHHRDRLSSASEDELSRWIGRLFEAASIDELLGD